MKEIISKTKKNKRVKGNVSLLVIFILLASSVIALLSINQIQHLLTYWNMTFNYFRAFYLAKAWTELWLTEVYYREAWFEDNIGSWDAIVSWNLVWAYSWFNPYFNMNISWKFLNLTKDIRYTANEDCTEDNKITLGSGEWIMLSLFSDDTKWFTKIFGENSDITPLNIDGEIKKIEMDYNKSWLTFWLFGYDKDLKSMNENIIVKKSSNTLTLSKFLSDYISKISWDRKYLTIKNSSDKDISFCINMGGKLIPYSNSLITVRGNYWNMEVWLQSIVEKEVPFWAMDVLWLY